MTIMIGLTGSIGMGKTTTSKMFADLGIPIWDADAVVVGLYGSNGKAIDGIRELVPTAITPDGIDKDELKRCIAADPGLLARVEDVVHPLVAADRQVFLNNTKDAALVVLDVPLLFETGLDQAVDHVVVVSAPPEVQRARVLDRGTMDEETFEMVLSKQMPDQQKRDRADTVIETVSLETARAAVQSLIKQLRIT